MLYFVQRKLILQISTYLFNEIIILILLLSDIYKKIFENYL